jgi:hypothetical protein
MYCFHSHLVRRKREREEKDDACSPASHCSSLCRFTAVVVVAVSASCCTRRLSSPSHTSLAPEPASFHRFLILPLLPFPLLSNADNGRCRRMSTSRRRLSNSTPSDSLQPHPTLSRSHSSNNSSSSTFTLSSTNQPAQGGSGWSTPRPAGATLYPPQYGGTGRKPSDAAFLLRETVRERWAGRGETRGRTVAYLVAGALSLWFVVARL